MVRFIPAVTSLAGSQAVSARMGSSRLHLETLRQAHFGLRVKAEKNGEKWAFSEEVVYLGMDLLPKNQEDSELVFFCESLSLLILKLASCFLCRWTPDCKSKSRTFGLGWLGRCGSGELVGPREKALHSTTWSNCGSRRSLQAGGWERFIRLKGHLFREASYYWVSREVGNWRSS